VKLSRKERKKRVEQRKRYIKAELWTQMSRALTESLDNNATASQAMKYAFIVGNRKLEKMCKDNPQETHIFLEAGRELARQIRNTINMVCKERAEKSDEGEKSNNTEKG